MIIWHIIAVLENMKTQQESGSQKIVVLFMLLEVLEEWLIWDFGVKNSDKVRHGNWIYQQP